MTEQPLKHTKKKQPLSNLSAALPTSESQRGGPCGNQAETEKGGHDATGALNTLKPIRGSQLGGVDLHLRWCVQEPTESNAPEHKCSYYM